jgi:hypothetical protein
MQFIYPAAWRFTGQIHAWRHTRIGKVKGRYHHRYHDGLTWSWTLPISLGQWHWDQIAPYPNLDNGGVLSMFKWIQRRAFASRYSLTLTLHIAISSFSDLMCCLWQGTAFIPGVHAEAPYHRDYPQSMSMYATLPKVICMTSSSKCVNEGRVNLGEIQPQAEYNMQIDFASRLDLF